ncbi:MAG: DUF167 domain-containing protein [Anaerolineales bacterium]
MSPKGRQLTGGRRGAALAIRLIPRAKRTEIVEILPDETIKIRVTAPALWDRANEALVTYLAKILDVAESRIEIVAGKKSRNKLVTILNMESAEAQARVLKALDS